VGREIYRSSTVTSTTRPARKGVDIERIDDPEETGRWFGL
jgi:hypothetical protein